MACFGRVLQETRIPDLVNNSLTLCLVRKKKKKRRQHCAVAQEMIFFRGDYGAKHSGEDSARAGSEDGRGTRAAAPPRARDAGFVNSLRRGLLRPTHTRRVSRRPLRNGSFVARAGGPGDVPGGEEWRICFRRARHPH